MPPSRKTSKRRAVIEEEEDTPGSAQRSESYARDVAAQDELLAQAAARTNGAGSSWTGILAAASAESTPQTQAAGKKKRKKRKLADLPGFDDLAGGGGGGAGAGIGAGGGGKKDKKVEAVVKLCTKMQGEEKNKLSGRAMYAINCVFDDNKALLARTEATVHQKPRFFQDWAKWAVRVPSAEIAGILHKAILADPKLKATSSKLNKHLDTTPFDNAVIVKPHFVLATSETQFETQADGLLPRSIMIIGKNTYDFKEFWKAQFEQIRYLDLVFNGGKVTKAAWVLPVDAQTEATGTLADFLRRFGATVDEEDLDEGENDSEEDDERDDETMIDDEAEEAEDEDE